MSNFSERLGTTSGGKKPIGEEWKEISIDFDCEECNIEAETVLYNKARKKVKIVCENNHEYEVEIDLSWLIH